MHEQASAPGVRAFDGGLVEVHGIEGKLEPSQDTREAHPSVEPVDVNGERGRAIGWVAEEGKCLVETFDGVVLGIPAKNLREFEPPDPEDGGFDLAWPSGPALHEDFAAGVIGVLARKGYCVVQMFASSDVRRMAMEEASELADWRLPAKELEAAYLGHDNITKYAVLPQDDFRQAAVGGLSQCDRMLSQLGLALMPLTQDVFGFSIDGRMSCNVCVPFATAGEERLLRPAAMAEQDYGTEEKLHGHVNFLALQRLKAMYALEGQGGEIELRPTPSAGPGIRPARLPLARNRLLVLLPEKLSYSYRPLGASLLLQTCFLSEPPALDAEAPRVVRVPSLQQHERVHVTALHVRTPGSSCDRFQAWAMWISGTDGAVRIPLNRFDVELYYNPEPYSGMLYTNHSATMHDYFMDHIDPEHFGMSELEASHMGAGQRNILEVGYETLYQAGFDKESLWGLNCGVFVGDKNTDRKGLIPPRMADSVYKGEPLTHFHHSGFNSGVTCSRLSYAFGMRGPVAGIDTACSSALVAMGQANATLRRPARGDLAVSSGPAMDIALVMGMDIVDGPFTLFAYCAAQMVSVGGRSFTFDEAANGFLRGDCVGGCSLETGSSDEEAQGMLACLMGTNVDQDGRSASLSAPHGPSQQQCIKASMAEAGLRAAEITIAECHGTGTALGDPIEVGALRETMKSRDVPIVMTSAKSNFGHTEAAAGMGGIARCMTMLLSMSGACNLHLRCINAHIEFVGYPALFITEAADCGFRTGISGVSSFGVGGTNARGDIWARSVYGYTATHTVHPVNKLQLANVLHARIKHNGLPGPGPSDRLYIMGTWDAWSEMVEMKSETAGEWTATVVLGDVQRERFRIVVNGEARQGFYPVVDKADQQADVQGPDWEGQGRSWLIDGRVDGGVPGTVYRIAFSWAYSLDTGELRRVTWEKLSDAGGSPPLADGRVYEHAYSVAGSWTAWTCCKMERVSAEAGAYETTVRIGATGQEEFHLVRDGDWTQVIHPATARAVKAKIPVRGPDDEGAGKAWLVRGPTGGTVTLRLQVSEGGLAVSAASAAGTRTWRSSEAQDWHDYDLVTERSGRDLRPMRPVPGTTGVYQCRVTLDEGGVEEFQVLVDKDWEMMLYPHIGGAGLAEGAVCGPDALGAGLRWRLRGRPGADYEVLLDWGREDGHKVLSWREVVENAPTDMVLKTSEAEAAAVPAS